MEMIPCHNKVSKLINFIRNILKDFGTHITTFTAVTVLLVFLLGPPAFIPAYGEEAGGGQTAAATMLEKVRADWERQEKRLNRAPQSAEAIEAAIKRTSVLLKDLCRMEGMTDLTAEQRSLERLTEQRRKLSRLNESERLKLYYDIRTLTRQLAMKNPLVTSRPIVFMQRHRAIGYMLYEYLGWYYTYGSDPRSGAKNPKFPTAATGGGIYVLTEPGVTMEVKELTAGRPGQGHFVTLSLSFDGQTIYFAFADPKGMDPYTLPGYARAPDSDLKRYNTFHIYAMDADGTNLRQLTDGPNDDFDPCPLPDGGIAFESTRRGSKLRCGGGSPELVYTLHRMNGDGRNIRTLSFHETNEWHPSVLNDGRIVYTRWDYVDRDAAKFHGLWTCNPDGTNPSILFGNYTTRPWTCYQAKSIPNSNRIVFVAGGHHANVGGTLVILDPSRTSLDPISGEDRFDSLEQLTPEVCFAEAEGWPKSYFYSPWALSENYFLVSFSYDPLPGGYTGYYRGTETGLYYFDRFGNLELLYRNDGISAVYPIPLAPRVAPPVLTGLAQNELNAEEGEFLVTDVTQSLFDMPQQRRVKQLRIIQLLPKSRTDNASNPRIGHPDQANARMLLGTVPVEDDGSAYFRAPACKPLYFQSVDDTGRAVQTMRSIVYLQPGERRSCVGCHEQPGVMAPMRRVAASRRPPSIIQPGPDGTKPFCYPRLVQPVLDSRCVRCHDGSTGPDKSTLVLTGEPDGQFSKSYNNLKPYLHWPSHTVTRPGKSGADISPLTMILADKKHRQDAKLSEEQSRALYIWLDSNVPFFGTYEEKDLQAQRLGLAVAPPLLQ